jgi:hypothetical protein
MYVEDESIPSRKAVSANDTLGRIPATSVPPPHTVDSLKRCITKAEGIINVIKCDVYSCLTSGTPMTQGPVSILASESDCPGSTPERAIALVYTIAEEVAPKTPVVTPNSKFNKRIVAIQDCSEHLQCPSFLVTTSSLDNALVNSKYLNFKKDEVLLTDGASHWEILTGGGGGESPREHAGPN